MINRKGDAIVEIGINTREEPGIYIVIVGDNLPFYTFFIIYCAKRLAHVLIIKAYPC